MFLKYYLKSHFRNGRLPNNFTRNDRIKFISPLCRVVTSLLFIININIFPVQCQMNYVIKAIDFCPIVTLDGNISYYEDDTSTVSKGTTMAECSLGCLTRENNLNCVAFSFNELTFTCLLHSNAPNPSSRLITKALYKRSGNELSGGMGTIEVQNGNIGSITRLIISQRLYQFSYWSCMFPFTLNGTLYRESCSITYTHIPGMCNTSVCPMYYHSSLSSNPGALWTTCWPYNFMQTVSLIVSPTVCETVNASLIQILPSKWILLQSSAGGSDTNYFNKSWDEFKVGFNTSTSILPTIDFNFNYWIGNEVIFQLTNLSCIGIFPDIPTPKPILSTTMAPDNSTTLNLSTANQNVPSTTSLLPTDNLSQMDALSNTATTTSQSTYTTTRPLISYQLITIRYWRLRIEIRDASNKWYSAEYNSFKVSPEQDNYKIDLKLYEGGLSDLSDNFLSSQSVPFATYDRNIVNGNYIQPSSTSTSSSTAAAAVGWWWDDNTTNTILNDNSASCFSTLNFGSSSCWRHIDGHVVYAQQTRMFIQPVQETFNVSFPTK